MSQDGSRIRVRQLVAADLAEADRIFRLAFSTFLGMEDPAMFMAGRELLAGRWEAYPDGAIGAFTDDTLIGSNFAANWGSFGWFGPLTVEPSHWDQGVAKHLLERTIETFERWDTKNAALFTFADSPKHQGLYQRFDFWPRYLSALMAKTVSPAVRGVRGVPQFQRFSLADEPLRDECLAAAIDIGNALLDGLDLRREVLTVERLHLGESLWLWSDAGVQAFAVCHYGPNSEAAPGTWYVKFAAVRPGRSAERWFVDLLRACEGCAAEHGLGTVEAGMNLERTNAYRAMLREGYRVNFCGVQMFRGNDPAYNGPDAYVIDDLR